MSGQKKSAAKAANLVWKLTAAAAAGAAVYGIYKLWSWSRDEYATALWIPCCGKGIRITKGPEKNTYLVQTGFTWQDEVPTEEEGRETSVMEIPLNELHEFGTEEGLEG